ncbi:MAG: type IV pilin protein [Granulosicoccus sp.]
MNSARIRGFTLVELLIALLIVSVLISLAVPNYQGYVQRLHRDDARHLLMLNAHRLQRCFTLEGVYNGSCVVRPLSEEGYYALTSVITSNTFELTATAVAGTSQASDDACQTFTYTHTGQKTASGSESDRCW